MTFNEEHAIETYKSLISIGSQALKTLQLLNGGAIIALLAYLGQVSVRPEVARRVSGALLFFVLGLVAGTLAYLTTYFTQFALYQESIQGALFVGRSHTLWLRITVALAAASLALFGWGAFTGVKALAYGSCN
ncbi:MAG: hypothetical protein HY535_03370 [Chloroflexi bacterium]|nr:hypothetical protein [Chloroflexota bacterium]